MARKSPAQKLEDLLTATRAWEMLRPGRSFFGHTLERFKQAIQPSLDATERCRTLAVAPSCTHDASLSRREALAHPGAALSEQRF